MFKKMRAHWADGSPPPCAQVQVQNQDEEEDPTGIQCNFTTQADSLYNDFKDTSTMPPCVTSTMSVGDSNQMTISATESELQDNNNQVNTPASAPKTQGAATIGWSTPVKDNKTMKSNNCDRAPSMANCLSTTVPVNLKASQIAGRHTPTRSSLRHSRMIVMHRTGNIPRKSRPPLLRRRKLSSTLAAIQTILGIAVTSLSLWLLLWAPNLPFMDNPYWSGMPLLFSGSFGICLLCCFKKEYPGLSPGFCLTATKVMSFFLAALAAITCLVACITSAIHLIRLSGLECTPARVINATCACRSRSELASTSEPVFKYVDLNCPEVEGVLTILLIFSSICNALGAIIAGWYCYLHWSTRDKRPQYFKVRSSSRAPLDSRPIYNPNLNRR
ncbi:uncharacterized protein LOC123267833 [Cotesia glomerata]|uniref:Sarcospan n=1 Tax=Cotesia glomerata TaxID=32391 RepID=A0AAV7HW03_COTGL|nr:uncharacterized protein LOC123267833 [Cotesia glomerata]XP_044588636.1 uncharacterized protein LOC123267833 [Cotesia glomerata]XP_044588637.1 uncharacterized protein LOC123267833 [Cotesia glomerata]KAH0535314.1 hypothetical protein KQX54_015813 [Cotesia glomerata]